MKLTDKGVVKHEWGYELLWAPADTYSGKILVFEQIHAKTPVQMHKTKNKTLFVNSGKFKIRWINTKDAEVFETEIPEGHTFEIKAMVPHQIINLSQNGSITEVGDKDDPADLYTIVKPDNVGQHAPTT